MIEIRDATDAGAIGILQIYNDVISSSTAIYRDAPATLEDRRAWLADRRAQGYPVLVAVDGDEVMGFASFGDFRAWPGYRYTVEHTVHVRADCRAQGIGGRLVDMLIERATTMGKHVMIAGVDADNERSLRFHERLGFERVAHFKQVGFKFGRWLDLIFLQRMLDSRPD